MLQLCGNIVRGLDEIIGYDSGFIIKYCSFSFLARLFSKKMLRYFIARCLRQALCENFDIF